MDDLCGGDFCQPRDAPSSKPELKWLVAEAAGADLKAKKLLFDVLVKLQQANICWDSARLPEIQLDGGESEARASVSDEIDRLAAAMTDEPPAQDQSPSEPQSQNRPGGEADPAGSPRTP